MPTNFADPNEPGYQGKKKQADDWWNTYYYLNGPEQETTTATPDVTGGGTVGGTETGGSNPNFPTTNGWENVPWDTEYDTYGNPIGGGGGFDFGSNSFDFGKLTNLGNAPRFNAPKFSFKGRFDAPDVGTMLQDPGYQFRVGEGQRALEQSAAGRGVLRTGGTLKDILKYGQQFASQEYGSVFDRALKGFETNYGVERDIFDRLYQGTKDEYTPELLQWQTYAAAKQKAAELELQKLLKEQEIQAGLLGNL